MVKQFRIFSKVHRFSENTEKATNPTGLCFFFILFYNEKRNTTLNSLLIWDLTNRHHTISDTLFLVSYSIRKTVCHQNNNNNKSKTANLVLEFQEYC